MKHAVFLALVVSYTVGLATFMFTLARYLAKHDTIAQRSMLFMGSATAAVISITLNYYLTLLSGFPSNPIMLYVTDIGLAVIVFALPAYVHALSAFPYAKTADTAGVIVSALICLMVTASYFFPDVTAPIMWMSSYALGFAFVYSAVIGVIGIMRGRPSGEKLQQRLFTVSIVCGITVWFLIEVIQPLKAAFGDIPSSVVALAVFYFSASTLLLYSGIRGIIHARTAPLAEAAHRYGLTGREAQIIEMLADGESYRAIADVFGITLPTVKTHVSKIYEKTGMRSKSALIHKFTRAAKD